MKFAIVTKNWLEDKGFAIQLHWRKSVDNNDVLIHYEKIKHVIDEEKDVVNVYEYDSMELKNICNSDKWIDKTQL